MHNCLAQQCTPQRSAAQRGSQSAAPAATAHLEGFCHGVQSFVACTLCLPGSCLHSPLQPCSTHQQRGHRLQCCAAQHAAT